MRAKVFERMEHAVNVEESDLGSVLQFYGRAAAGRDRVGRSDRYDSAAASRFTRVYAELSHIQTIAAPRAAREPYSPAG